jgi:outer membrane receptor protein involved in Fe transport
MGALPADTSWDAALVAAAPAAPAVAALDAELPGAVVAVHPARSAAAVASVVICHRIRRRICHWRSAKYRMDITVVAPVDAG